MYIIVTTNKELVEQARKVGANVFEDIRIENTQEIIGSTVDDCERRVEHLLSEFAFKPNILGYGYLKHILLKCAKDSNYHMEKMVSVIYPQCAKEFNSTSTRVERAIRHAIEVSFGLVPEKYAEFFGPNIKGGPKNGEFISTMSVYLNRATA